MLLHCFTYAFRQTHLQTCRGPQQTQSHLYTFTGVHRLFSSSLHSLGSLSCKTSFAISCRVVRVTSSLDGNPCAVLFQIAPCSNAVEMSKQSATKRNAMFQSSNAVAR